MALNAYAATLTPEQYVRDLVNHYGQELATTTREEITQTIKCESNFNSLAIGTQHEKGLVQIHPMYHPNISATQAFDPDFSVQFIIKAFKENHQHWWSCWRSIYGVK